jgi:hypothetical protein
MLCILTHDMCVLHYYVELGIFSWAYIKKDSIWPMGEWNQMMFIIKVELCKLKISISRIICLKLAVHLVIMDFWRWVLTKLYHNGLWGSKLKSSRRNNDQAKHSGLTGAWSIVIKIKRDAWYVSNVSIIFYAPYLFTHHLLCVLLHFVAFLCIFRN